MWMDGVPAEMFKFGKCVPLVQLLLMLYNNIIFIGYIPESFNTSVLKPIPKKNSLASPSDYRPISVSSILATLFEALLIHKLDIVITDPNQFGYY